MALLLFSTMVAARISALAQGDHSDWQTLSPEGEEFSILMPKDPKFEESKEPYHRDMTLNTRLYLSAPAKGPVLAVVSLSGIKATPGSNEFLRLNSYVDAFKNWFPQKVRGKDAIAKLTLVGEQTLYGNNGREYKLVIGDLTGTARVFTTRRRFYAAVILNTKKDDELTAEFFNSFSLPEKAAPAAEVAAATPADAAAKGKKDENKATGEEAAKGEGGVATGAVAEAGGGNGATGPSAEAKSADTTPKKPGEKAPINGGMLNGKAISLPQPEYPAMAEAAHAGGLVIVQVVIDEIGNVISAHATQGHPLLQAAAVAAARQAKFAPTSLMGEPIKVSGILTYNFVAK
jgi:TonB family protein